MKKYFSIALAALAAGTIQATPLSPDQALARALEGENTPGGSQQAPGTYTLVTTRFAGTEPAVYVFNTPGKFLITSADTRVRPCLGYGDGMINPENLPSNVAAWLDGYANEIEAFLASEAARRPSTFTVSSTATPAVAAAASRPSIAPLCTSQWDQDAPYNNLCPVVRGSRSVTGCAATAMAQVMRKHKHPAKGSGSNEYTDATNGMTLSANFAESTYDWANMLDTYATPSSGTEAQRTAVAQLMYDCGVSLNMSYNASVSGSLDFMAPYALTKYFSYDANTIMEVYRDGYATQEEWDNLIYASLAEGMPTIYNGQATKGGHSFVCDGYSSSNGMFHINWGWGGYCDGYFPLSALNPTGQGIGGYEGGYNSHQSAVIGIRPTPAGIEQRVHHHMVGSGAFTYNGYSFKLAKYVASFCFEPTDYYLGVKIVDGRGNVKYFMNTSLRTLSGYDSNPDNRGWYVAQPSFYVEVDGLAPGTYRVYPAVQVLDAPAHQLPLDSSTNPMIYLTVDENGKYTYTDGVPTSKSNLEITSFKPANGGEARPGVETTYTLSIKNNGPEDYSGLLYLSLNSDLSYNNSEIVEVRIPINQSADISLTTELTAGLHTLHVGNSTLTEIAGSPLEFTVGADDALIVAKSIAPVGQAYANTPIAFNITVQNAGKADFNGDVNIGVFPIGEDSGRAFAQTISVKSGATYTWTTPEVELEDFTAGDYVVMLLNADKQPTSAYRAYFTAESRPDLRLNSVTPMSGLTDDTWRLEIAITNEGTEDYSDIVDIVAVDSNGQPEWSTQYDLKASAGRRSRFVLAGVKLIGGYYTLSITDISGNAILDSGMRFTIRGAGIESADTAAPTVTVADGKITVSDAPAGASVSLTTTSGVTLDRTEASADGSATLATGSTGIGILTVGNKAFKVVM